MSKTPSGFVSLDGDFEKLIGAKPSLRLLARHPSGAQLFHEAGIYSASTSSVWLSSNRLEHPSKGQHGHLIRVPLDAIPPPSIGELNAEQSRNFFQSLQVHEDLKEPFALPNGGTPLSTSPPRALWCEQGRSIDGIASTIIEHRLDGDLTSSRVVLEKYQGLPFSSLNDVVEHPATGAIFFTDPDYGVEQQFKDPKVRYAPNGLYVADLESGEVRLIDDKYSKPNGVTFRPSSDAVLASRGAGTLFTTDTARFRFKHPSQSPMGDFYVDESGPAAIYAYDVLPNEEGERLPRVDVDSRKLWAESTAGVPDGIHPDKQGNIWAGHGDGVHVYRGSDGKLIGKILLPDGHGVANFCWAGAVEEGKDGEEGSGQRFRLLLFAEDELWEVVVGVDGSD